jgi:hypothetical protein
MTFDIDQQQLKQHFAGQWGVGKNESVKVSFMTLSVATGWSGRS